MSIFRRTSILLALVFYAMGLSSCDQTPTGPGSSTGNLLEASVNGTTFAFAIQSKSYDPSIFYANVLGTHSSTSVTRSMTVTFESDITAGTYPRTIDRNNVNIIYVEIVNGVAVNYDCSTQRDDCTLTLTASNGSIVDGTFSGHLTSRDDATKHVEITNGRFSARLQ